MNRHLFATLTVAALLMLAPAAGATVVPDATSVTVGDAPAAVAAAAETAFVANAAADTISVINTRSRTRNATITLADGAQPVALTIDGTRLAVVEAGLDRLELRDTVTRAQIGVVDLRDQLIVVNLFHYGGHGPGPRGRGPARRGGQRRRHAHLRGQRGGRHAVDPQRRHPGGHPQPRGRRPATGRSPSRWSR
jgi:YVTN family beta-propeller protein